MACHNEETCRSDYIASVNYYEKNWRLLDDTMRRLCRMPPGHLVRSAVHVVHWSSDLEVFSMPTQADETYAWQTMRFLKLYNRVRVQKLPVNVKYLDHYLIWLADKRIQGSRI